MATSEEKPSPADPETLKDAFDHEEAIEAFFPYGTPYDNQVNGIKNTLNTFYNNGFHLIEGPCGTGKTLISLTAAMAAIRNSKTKYERALIVTNVKQQQTAFEEDIKTINEYIIDKYGHKRKAPYEKRPINSLTIVGKQDLCAYTDSGAISTENVSGRCSTLQTNTRDMGYRLADTNNVSSGAAKIIEAAKTAKQNSEGDKSVKESMGKPTFENIDESVFEAHPFAQFDSKVCPFYAQALIDNEKETTTVNYDGMMDARALRNKAAKLGTCPYEVMKKGIRNAEILIGNYAHVFDKGTVQATTQSIIDENTLLIVDEGHMLIEGARSLLGRSITRNDILEAITEIEKLREHKSQLTPRTMVKIEKKMRQAQITINQTKSYENMFRSMLEFVDAASSAYCKRQYNSSNSTLTKNEEFPLRPPDKAANGQLKMWMNKIDYDEEWFETLQYATKAIGGALNIAANNSNINLNSTGITACEKVGSFLTQKYYSNESNYITTVNLSAKESNTKFAYDFDTDVTEQYNITLDLQNCIPTNDLANTFEKFGGGLIMSATLSPTDVTSKIIGLQDIDTPTDSDKFDLSFPKENRESLIVDLDPFTYNNRGNPIDNNKTRREYSSVILDIIENVKGNTLICAPSYTEAEWVGDKIEDVTGLPVYIDESSTNDETINMRDEFVEKDKAVLCTSLRGTLTEGVDYAGDDLSNVIVLGVPLTYPNSLHGKAIKNTYTLKFGGKDAFDYAFTLPAVFKTRQALGRVIRSSNDTGIRILLDRRYKQQNSAREFLSDQQKREYTVVDKDEVGDKVSKFWDSTSI